MKIRYLLPILLLTSTTLLAQDRFAFTASAVRSDIRRDNGSNDALRYGSSTGYGAALDLFWSRWLSTEIAASSARLDVRELQGPTTYRYGTTRMMPMTASLLLHFTPMTMVDTYAGAGAGWLRFSDLKQTSALADLDIDRVEFSSRAGVMGQAGLTIGSWRGVGLNVDAKYIDAKTRSRARFTNGDISSERELNVSPWLWSAGVRVRF